MPRRRSVVGHALAGWFVCGATIGVGRLVLSLHATLVVHAVVAPLAFGLLAWHHTRRYPHSPPVATALAMLSIVVGLDALLVAPFFERSYAMFGSVLGTWLPFLLIFTAVYLVGRMAGRQAGSRPQEGRGLQASASDHRAGAPISVPPESQTGRFVGPSFQLTARGQRAALRCREFARLSRGCRTRPVASALGGPALRPSWRES